MKINGHITIDVERKTVSISLYNGSWVHDHYTNGIKRFLDEEIEFLQKKEGIKYKKLRFNGWEQLRSPGVIGVIKVGREVIVWKDEK